MFNVHYHFNYFAILTLFISLFLNTVEVSLSNYGPYYGSESTDLVRLDQCQNIQHYWDIKARHNLTIQVRLILQNAILAQYYSNNYLRTKLPDH